jgi:protein ImuA
MAGKEQPGPKGARSAFARWHLGLEAVDNVLPNASLPLAGVHEISPFSVRDGAAASGFCLALVVRLLGAMRSSGTVLWCARGVEAREYGDLYAPGLIALGLSPDNMLIVRAERDRDILWAMEEGLKTPGLGAVVGEVAEVELSATRRLLMASEKACTPCLLLRPAGGFLPSAAFSRWRVAAAASGFAKINETVGSGDFENVGKYPPQSVFSPQSAFPPQLAFPRWRVELARCRGLLKGGWPQSWNLDWNYETHAFHMAAPLADRSAAPHATLKAV